ncbi:hypothetical protein T484DRAFT_3486863 [Baffinella frigidus]|nr:hypothetical protein T484DRAFT_3486863 [Cryptophyta sp. CCMP2293]
MCQRSQKFQRFWTVSVTVSRPTRQEWCARVYPRAKGGLCRDHRRVAGSLNRASLTRGGVV